MYYIFGSPFSTGDKSNETAELKTAELNTTDKKISDTSTTPLENTPPKKPEESQGYLSRAWNWACSFGSSGSNEEENKTEQKITNVAIPKITEDPESINTSDDSDDDLDTSDSDDEQEFFDCKDSFDDINEDDFQDFEESTDTTVNDDKFQDFDDSTESTVNDDKLQDFDDSTESTVNDDKFQDFDESTETADEDLEFFECQNDSEDFTPQQEPVTDEDLAKHKSTPINTTDESENLPNFGMGDIDLSDEEFQLYIEELQKKADNTEADKRGWIGYISNYLAGTYAGQYVVGNDWARNKIKNYLFEGTDFGKMADKMQEDLKLITGDYRLAIAVGTGSKKGTEIIVDSVIKSYPKFEKFIKLEDELLKQIVRGISLKAARNLSRYAGFKIGKDFKGDFTIEMSKIIMKIVNEELDKIDVKEYKAALEIKNINTRNDRLREIFQPISDKILEIALPKGEKDLKLGKLSGSVWDAISKEVIPDLFCKIYSLTHEPAHHTEEDLKKLKENPGGAGLKALATYIAEKSKDIIPKALDKNGMDVGTAVVGLLTDDLEESLWLRHWIKDRLSDITNSKDPELTRIWEYAEGNVKSYIIHALANLSEGDSKNLVANVGKNGLAIIDDFFTEKKRKELAEKFKSNPPPKGQQRSKKQNEALNELFKPLANTIMEQSGLADDEIIKLVKEHILPPLLRDFYESMYLNKDNVAEYTGNLENHLFDPAAFINQSPEVVVQNFAKVIADPDKGKSSHIKEAGVKDLVESFDKMLGKGANVFTRIIKNFTEKDKEIIAKKINDNLLKKTPLTDKELKEFGEGIQELMSSDDKSLKNTWSLTESLIKSTTFKLLSLIATNKTAKGKSDRTENVNKELPAIIFKEILTILATHIPTIDKGLEEIKKDTKLSQDKKNEAINKLYEPLVKQFTGLAGKDWEKIMPIPEYLQGPARELLETNVLPAIFHTMYTDMNSLRYQSTKNEVELNKTFKSDNGKKAVDMLGNHIEELIPDLMKTNSEKIAEIVSNVGSEYLQYLTPEHQNEVKELFSKTVKKLGEDQSILDASKAVSEYSKGMCLKILNGMATKSKDFNLLDFAIKVLSGTSEHVKRINDIPPGRRNFPAHWVPAQAMHNGFVKGGKHKTNILDKALEKDFDKNMTQEEKDQYHLKMFFEPLAADFVDITGIKAEDFPAPGPLREMAFNLFKEKVLPQVLMSVFNEVLKPESINQLMLKVFDTLNEAVDDLDNIPDQDAASPEDPEQHKLNAALGTLIKEMVDLVPDFWTMTVFDSEKIKSMTDETIGRIVRSKIDNTSMIEIMNTVLGGLTLPKPGADRNKTDAQKAKENKRVEKELNQKMTAYISKQAKEKVNEYLKGKWDKFQDSFDKIVKNCFGKPGLALKHFLDDICHFIFFTVIGTILNHTIMKLVWFLVDMKISEKSEEIIKDVQMPINRNLVYKLARQWAKDMKGEQKVEETAKQLVDDVAKDKKEKEEEAARIKEEQRIADAKEEAEKKKKSEDEALLEEQMKNAQNQQIAV